MKRARIAVIGSYLAGLTMRVPRFPAPGETLIGSGYTAFHGGKGSNQAVACARLGAEVSFASCVGQDALGQAALSLYEREGVNAGSVRLLTEAPTGVGFILVNEAGENVITLDLGACGRMGPESVEPLEELIRASDMVLCQLEIPLETVCRAAQIAGQVGTPLLLNPAPFQELPRALLSQVSVFTPNEGEAKRMCGLTEGDAAEPEVLASQILDMGVERLVITLGARGAYCAQGDHREFLPAQRVQAVDTTGAGDTFSAALAVALCEGRTLCEAVAFAQRAAALAVGRYGVIEALPYRRELEG